MSQFVRRWANWSAAGASTDPERHGDSTLQMLGQRTDKTAKSPFVSFVSAQDGHSEADFAAVRCTRCQALESEGAEVLLCEECGYHYPVAATRNPVRRHPPRAAGRSWIRLVTAQQQSGRVNEGGSVGD